MFENFYMNIKLVNETAIMPTRATDGDAGLDVFTPYDFDIQPGDAVVINLKWQMEFPKGYSAIVREKSGIAVGCMIDVGANVIDAGYRGNVKIHLINNHPTQIAKFDRGDPIAQIIVVPVWAGQPNIVEEFIIKETERGEGGFGSTGPDLRFIDSFPE